VAERLGETGELSKPDIVLMRIVDVATVKASVDVTDEPLRTIVAGQEVHVTVDAFPDRYFLGRVASKNHLAGTATASSALSVEIGNPEKLLKPGMYAHLRLIFDRFNRAKIAALPRLAANGLHNAPAVAGVPDVVSSLTALTKTLGAEAQELQKKESAAQATGEASRQYFALLERLIDGLRGGGKRARAASLERTADKIDDAPTLHVDDELLAFGVEVSRILRDMAEKRRAIARVIDVPDLSLSDRAQSASNAIKTQGLTEIHNGLVEVRRKLTKKYDLEFLATITPTSSSAASRDTRRARR